VTMIDPRVLDVTGFDRPVESRAGAESGDLHVLRLTLELQLDALLFTLGAAAHAQAAGEGDDDRGPIPWQRWLTEDLQLARALAAVLLEGDVSAVPGLGGGMADVGADTSLDNLADHYASMERLLADALTHRGSGRWRLPAVEALSRCRIRLAEVHELRRRMIVTEAVVFRPFLPGELLG